MRLIASGPRPICSGRVLPNHPLYAAAKSGNYSGQKGRAFYCLVEFRPIKQMISYWEFPIESEEVLQRDSHNDTEEDPTRSSQMTQRGILNKEFPNDTEGNPLQGVPL